MIRNQFISCAKARVVKILLPSIVFLFICSGFVHAQNVLSVPFSNGFVGDNTGNNSAGNCYYTNSLGFTNLQFVQNSTGTQFVEQGNDIVGSVVFYDAAGTYRSIPGFVKWRAPSGTVTTMVFRPSSATVTNVATNGTNGSATYPISSSKYIGLTFNGNTLTIGGSGSVSGNAATNGLLQELNTYLGNLPSITIANVSISENGGSAVVTVTLSSSSSNVVTVQYNTSDSTATAGLDYTAESGTVTFNVGQTSRTITISILDDASLESNELFHIELSNSTNASILDFQSVVTILDNEVAPVPGCTDSDACNYNASATQDNGSCTYPTQSYLNCAGDCLNDTDNDGICNELEVPGCTSPTACNYNAFATDDNNTCTYPTQTYLNCAGNCINDTDNDGVCNELEVLGCTDPTACNYNAAATDDDASCTYPAQSHLNCDGSCINDTDNDGICNEMEVPGCTDPTACNYNAAATDEDVSCTYPSQTYFNCDGSCINDTDIDGICNELEVPGCTDPTACNYNAAATDDNASCTYPTQTYLNCDGSCINDTDNDGICNELEVPGCTDPTACNFNAAATDDNATCTYPTQTYLNCDGSCINDFDNDGVCNEEEILGCTDPTACNFNVNATDENGTCSYASLIFFVDNDGDGEGLGDALLFCSNPGAGYVNNDIDCNDMNAAINTQSTEICDEVDNDCDGEVDEFVTTTYYLDSDGDGFGNVNETVEACELPEGYSENSDDCDDDLLTFEDFDEDGFGTDVIVPCGASNELDCDDTNPSVYAGATDICGNGIDEDCSNGDSVCVVTGCMDITACNFNPSANEDDASCTYPAQTYLNCDGSCINDTDNDGICNELEVPGCTDPTACNYNAAATDDNATCTYPSQIYLNCDGSCINDSDNDGICNENEISGCTDPEACNYNSLATNDDATCTYPAQSYLNCDGSCINDTDNDGVCDEHEVLGCTDPEACNYNDAATEDDASCTYPAQSYLNCDGSCINDSDNDGVCDEIEVSGCTDPEACNYNSSATNDDATCTYPAQSYLNCDGSCINDTDNDGVCDEHEVLGCTDPEACNYNSLATDDDATCTYPAQSYLNCDGSCINDEDADGICNELEVLGCTHSDACNYNATATEEDESCTYPIQPYLNCDGSCINDADNDGVCDENEYTGCTDPTACNYNPEATNEDGTCIYPTQSYLNCDGVCINDEDADGICTEVEGTDDIDNDGIPNNLDVDSDGDGIDDAIEGVLDADNDGHPNFLDLDSDGDGISDDIELTADMDEDGMPNYLDLDSDGDGILDSIELINDVDGDGSPNFLDLDSDGDGIDDATEGNVDTDGDNTPNYLDLDSDDDGINDSVELTDDMDGDNTPNYLDVDSDGDGILDETELTNDMDGDSAPNYLDVDSDGDGILDEVEGNVDSDGDGTPNYLDLDSDGDGISDETEGTVDSDGDGTADYLDLDSDGDGVLDETEGTTDTDGDGLPDYLDVDSDNDGVNDGDEVLGCTDASACDFNPLATESAACSYDAGELLIGEIQNASCGSGLGNVQVLNFENFTTFYLVEQDQEISATATINGLSDGQYAIVGKRTGSCISDTVIFVVGYNADCAPNAENDTLLINEDAGMMQLNLVFNDSDSDNNLDPTTIDLDPSTPGLQTTSTGLEGDWSLDGNGILNFTPAQNYNGIATRLYVVSDASGLTSNTAEIFIQVSPVNDAPNVVPASLEVAVDLNSTTTICLDATDIDGDAVNVSSWILMEGLGTINDNATDDYCFDFTATGWQIPTNVMVVMCDNGSPSLCDTAWITINVSPLKPIAIDDYITSNDGLVNIDVVLNDTLYGDNNFTITIIDSTDFGRVDLDTSLISYQPDWSYCGLDSMTYSVCNSFGMCDTATVYFEVTPIDSDLDGIPDFIETVTADIDGDGIFNHLDEDSDGDGLSDAEESGMTDLCSPTLSDCNGNGIPDYLDFNNCIPDLEIPEGFSPNGDGVNDTWVIPGIENYPGNTMVVFNRWGNQVYSAEPYDNSWNGECNESGTLGGNTLPEGTYFFIFKSERNATAKQGYIYIKR